MDFDREMELESAGIDAFAFSLMEERKGVIKGYPVGVLFCISRMADAKDWDQQVDEEPLRERLTGSETLDKSFVAAVLGLL